jgi:hypothetical protein
MVGVSTRRLAWQTVLVAAHGNSIRGILKYLDGISDEEITQLEIPTGIPLVYRLDKNLQPIKSELAVRARATSAVSIASGLHAAATRHARALHPHNASRRAHVVRRCRR